MLGTLQRKMAEVAPKLRDHLTLVYAIETKHRLVSGSFHEKKILLTNEVLDLLGKASSLVLEHLGTEKVPFSMRLEERAIRLASAMSLMNYFRTRSDVIPIDSTASRMAIQFFVEEAWIRSRERFSLHDMLRKLF